MRSKLKKLILILFVFFLFEILEIRAHNTINGGCKEHCSDIFNKKENVNKIRIFKKDERSIIEENSCVNNSLCRG